jgi:hypothetical protein
MSGQINQFFQISNRSSTLKRLNESEGSERCLHKPILAAFEAMLGCQMGLDRLRKAWIFELSLRISFTIEPHFP